MLEAGDSKINNLLSFVEWIVQSRAHGIYLSCLLSDGNAVEEILFSVSPANVLYRDGSWLSCLKYFYIFLVPNFNSSPESLLKI